MYFAFLLPLRGEPKAALYREKLEFTQTNFCDAEFCIQHSQVKLQRIDKPPADNGVLFLGFQQLSASLHVPQAFNNPPKFVSSSILKMKKEKKCMR